MHKDGSRGPYDLAVIGGGSGGLTAAITGGRLGARTILIDKESLGGDCLHWGCVPSKALIASSRLAHKMRRAADFGIASVDVEVDIALVMARIRAVKDDIGAQESPAVLREHGVEVAFGGAKFIDPHTIAIGDERQITAQQIIVATGSTAAAPPIDGLSEAGYLDHVSIFSITELPDRLVVLGGGPVGCEIGQALSRLGAKVTILQRGPRLLPRETSDASDLLASCFAREDIDVRLMAEAVGVTRDGDGLLVRLIQNGEDVTIRSDAIFVAVGRRPSLSGLGLKHAGVATNKRGIVVDDALRTSQPHIYAVGDCNGGPQFTHWAEREARAAVRNALFRGTERRSITNVPAVTFTDPEIAHVGLTLEEARASHEDAHAHRVQFSHIDRAVCEGESTGFIEVIVDRKERILGAHIIGPEAGEVLTEWIVAIEHGITLTDIGAIIHPYPTLSRANRRVSDQRFFEHGVGGWLTRLAAKFDMPERS